MSNLEHAIEILEDEHDPFAGPIDAPALAYALNDAGLIAPDPDLAHTVIEQAARIARQAETVQTLSRLLTGAEEALQEAGRTCRNCGRDPSTRPEGGTATGHEQAATAALEWLRRQSDRLGTTATRHGLDPFNAGYLHAVDATAHMLGQLLHATRLAPGAPVLQHPGVHDDADRHRHRARARARAEREAHPEHGPHTRATKEHENDQ